jgi:hypothetical protein
MLFALDRHEPLAEALWNESRAREAICTIVQDTEGHHLAEGRWRLHALDDEGDEPRTGFKSLYIGSAGVWWALWYLQRAGAAVLRSDSALWEGSAVNWPPGRFTPRAGAPRMLMQWCHGAPGIVTALAGFPPQRSAEMDALLIGAGHAVWQAGPLAKGHGLCHGTAGNGYAFLKLYQRTGDALWLERARSFAMHAIGQWERLRAQHGQGRYTLWTGDPGLAVYLWHCLDGSAGLPALDMLQ